MASASADLLAAADAQAIQLVDSTPSKEEMEGNVARIKQDFLKNLKLGLDLDIADSEAFTQEVMNNIAKAEGIKATAKQIQQWSNMTYDQIAASGQSLGIDLGGFVNSTQLATAQAGLDTASKAYGDAYSLFSVTDGILEGKGLTAGEAVQLGATAVSLASTVIAGAAGGAALGPYGAVVGVVLAGVSYFISKSSAELQLYQDNLRRATATTAAEIQKMDTDNAQIYVEFSKKLDMMRKGRDQAVSEVADNWASYEEDLGVRFGLRYFPGSPVPPRAGTYTKIERFYTKPTTVGALLPHPCKSLAGCPYFPEPLPKRVAAIGYERAFAEMVDQLALKGQYLANPDLPIDSQYVMTEQGFSAYYDRTLRAFSAYVGGGTFWRPPNEIPLGIKVKGYGHHLVDLEYELADACSNTTADVSCNKSIAALIEQDRANRSNIENGLWARMNNLNFANGYWSAQDKVRYTDNYQSRTIDKLNQLRAKDAKKGQAIAAKVFERNAKFWIDLNRVLEAQHASTNVFKIRISADLLQTANAVGGELATSLRLQQLIASLGTRNIQQLTQSQKSDRALSQDVVARIEKRKSRDDVLNNGMLAVGLGAAGYGAFKKWG